MSGQHRLLSILTTYFDDAAHAYSLFDEFLRRKTYCKCLCLKLLAVSQQRTETWNLRRLAILMLEHQILKIEPDNLDDFDFLFTQLNLKEAPGINAGIAESVLKEGFSTTDLRQFVIEFRHRLQRLNRIHEKIRGPRTSEASLRDFLELSRRDCKLTLARYLFTADEVVDEILSQLIVTNGAKDLDSSQPLFVEAETQRALRRLPDFEAGILTRLCQSSRIYWVAEGTNSEINSLVEYPLTTVVLTIKPPGSNIEFEIKRAGRRGPFGLNVVYARDGHEVPPSHRLDGGNMQWLLRHEARAAARLGLVYRSVHDLDAPLANYVARSTIYSIPAGDRAVQTVLYFTEPQVFADKFEEMRQAMKEGLAAFTAEGYAKLPDLPGELGLTAQFIGVVTPAQSILSGTSSYRVDKLVGYISSNGPRLYFEEGLNIAYSKRDARALADEVLEEVLGVYQPPEVSYQNHEQYVAAAFLVPENRTRADRIYASLLQEIGRTWGTILALRGYSRGESFVARNVGLKSCWDAGEWKVRIIFMDHDSVVIPGRQDKDFSPLDALPSMTLDETYLWGKAGVMLGTVGHLRIIYRTSDELYRRGLEVARIALKDAYKKSQRELSNNPELRALFHPTFIERLADWDTLIKEFLRTKPGTPASSKWKDKKKAMLVGKGYEEPEFDAYIQALEENRAFLERHSFLFEAGSGKGAGTGRL